MSSTNSVTIRIGRDTQRAGAYKQRLKFWVNRQLVGQEGLRLGLITVAILCWRLIPPVAGSKSLALVIIVFGLYPLLRASVLSLLRGHLTNALCFSVAVAVAFLTHQVGTAFLLLLLALMSRTWERALNMSLLAVTPPANGALEPSTEHENAKWLSEFLIYTSFASAIIVAATEHRWAMIVSILVAVGTGGIRTSGHWATATGIAKAARLGVMLDESALALLAKVNAVVLDFTAVITCQRGQIVSVNAATDKTLREVLTVAAASVQSATTDVAVGQAIMQFARKLRLPLVSRALPGVRWSPPILTPNGYKTFVITQNECPLGSLIVAKTPGRASDFVLRLLSRLKVDCLLLSSDVETSAMEIAKRFGIDRVEAEIFPDDLPCKVLAMLRKGRRVMVVRNPFRENGTPVMTHLRAEAFSDLNPVLRVECGWSNALGLLSLARMMHAIVERNSLAAVIAFPVLIGLAMAGTVTAVQAGSLALAVDLMLILNAGRTCFRTGA